LLLFNFIDSKIKTGFGICSSKSINSEYASQHQCKYNLDVADYLWIFYVVILTNLNCSLNAFIDIM